MHAQGPLAPGAAPAPTMKRLDEVEPRVNLQPASGVLPAGVTTDATNHIIINQPGSYYLSANLLVTKTNGIEILSAGVTIDLEGFEISRGSGSGGIGILVQAISEGTILRNGKVRDFSTGVDTSSTLLCLVQELTATGCAFTGISCGNNARVTNCRAAGNGNGIAAGSGSVLTGCIASANTNSTSAGAGLKTAAGSSLFQCTASGNAAAGFVLIQSSLRDCAAYNNAGDGFTCGFGCSVQGCVAISNKSGAGFNTESNCSLASCIVYDQQGFGGIGGNANTVARDCVVSNSQVTYGFVVNGYSTIVNCAAYNNTSNAAASYGILTGNDCNIIGCTSNSQVSTHSSSGTTGAGISTGFRSTVRDCTANLNRGDGIIAGDDCLVFGNNCSKNGLAGDGAGIHVTGTAGRVEGNHVTLSPRGLQVDQSRNFIVRNTMRSNTSNFEVAPGNRVAQILVPAANAAQISGNAASSDGFTNADPWANFSF